MAAKEASVSVPVSVVIPAYEEEDGIGGTVRAVRSVLEKAGIAFELLVIDDGSSDRTAERAAEAGAVVHAFPENRGYGAALKEGFRRAKHEHVVIIDADGTYPPEAIPALVAEAERYDMVVGARIGENVAIPLERRPAKWVLARLASYLVGRDIPDLNSGLRVIRRELVERF